MTLQLYARDVLQLGPEDLEDRILVHILDPENQTEQHITHLGDLARKREAEGTSYAVDAKCLTETLQRLVSFQPPSPSTSSVATEIVNIDQQNEYQQAQEQRAYEALLSDRGVGAGGVVGLQELWTKHGYPEHAFTQQLKLWGRFRRFQDRKRQCRPHHDTFQTYAHQVRSFGAQCNTRNVSIRKDRRRQTVKADWLEFRHFCSVRQRDYVRASTAVQQECTSLRCAIENSLTRLGADQAAPDAEQRQEVLLQRAHNGRSTRRRDLALRVGDMRSKLVNALHEYDRLEWEIGQGTDHIEWVDQQFVRDYECKPARRSKRLQQRR